MTIFYRLLFILAWSIYPIVALSASFDCDEASTKAEIAICSDEILSRLDGEIGAVYKALDQSGDYYQAIRKEQKIWINSTRSLNNFDFKRQRDFLKFINHFSDCLEQDAVFMSCEEKISNTHLQSCMEMEGYSNPSMNRCGSAYQLALEVIESVETNKVISKLKHDSDTSLLFQVARSAWLDYREADCKWQYSQFRDGSMRNQVWLGCMHAITIHRIIDLYKRTSTSD